MPVRNNTIPPKAPSYLQQKQEQHFLKRKRPEDIIQRISQNHPLFSPEVREALTIGSRKRLFFKQENTPKPLSPFEEYLSTEATDTPLSALQDVTTDTSRTSPQEPSTDLSVSPLQSTVASPITKNPTLSRGRPPPIICLPVEQLPQTKGEPGLIVHCAGGFDSEKLSKIEEVLRSEKGIQYMEQGSSNSLLILDQRGDPIAIFKPETRELGTEWECMKSQDKYTVSKSGIKPGEGAFREFLASEYIRELLLQAEVSPSEMAVPHTAYVTCGSIQLFTTLPSDDHSLPYCVVEKGSLHQFELSCRTLKACEESPRAESTEDIKKPSALADISTDHIHILAVIDLILNNADRNSGNLLIQGKRLLLIDHAAILPARGESAAVFSWLTAEQLQKPLSQKTLTFIEQLKPELLLKQLEKSQKLEIEKALSFNPDSLEAHTIAIELLQQGIKQGLSLYQLAVACSKTTNFNERENAIAVIFEKMQTGVSREAAISEFLTDYQKNLMDCKANHPNEAEYDRCVRAKHLTI